MRDLPELASTRTSADTPTTSSAAEGLLPPSVSLRRACEADRPRVLDLLVRHGHRVVGQPLVAIVATIKGEIVAVAVGSPTSCAADADLALEPEWIGHGLGAALGRALGDELCAPRRVTE